MKVVLLYRESKCKSRCKGILVSYCGTGQYEKLSASICSTFFKYRFSQSHFYIMSEFKI